MRILKLTLILVLLISTLSKISYTQNYQTNPPAPVLADCETTIAPEYPEGNVYLSNTAGSFTITVNTESAGCYWNVSATNSTWLTFTPTGGSGNGTFTVSYNANNTTSYKTSVLDIEGNKLYLRQDPIEGGGGGGGEPPICPEFEPKKTLTITNPINDDDCRIYNGVIQARDKVNLTYRFSYSATTAPLTIKTNSDLICSASYVYSPINGSTRAIDKNLEVGSLPGSVDVSPSGAAVYNIPILIPQGTGGMQPNISITYNSQQDISILGKGFNIGGLSAITRVPRDLYHDGMVSGITYNSDDRYTIDGNRLMLVSGTYGGDNSEYRTEQNTFAKISFNGNCFIVETKDGRILEYGTSYDSFLKPISTSAIYAYYLKRVFDNNGNYMTYNYEKSDGELWIKRIDYTGHSQLTPYNSIIFFYDERFDHKTYYISGGKFLQRNLLREIIIKTNDKIVRKYNFKYATDDINESYLNEIIESNGNDEKYNSTVINWGENNLFNITPEITNIPQQSLPSYNDYETKYYTSFDMNGDGLSDLVHFFKYKQVTDEWQKAVQIYIAESDEKGKVSFTKPSNQFYSLGVDVNWETFKNINTGPLCGDLFGIGKMELITPVYCEAPPISPKILRFYIQGRGWGHNFNLNNNQIPLYTLQDIDNNGRANFIYLETIKTDGYYKGAIVEITSKIEDINSGEDIQFTSVPLSLPLGYDPKALFTGDYNSDGLVDFRVVTKNNIITYLNTNGSFNQSTVNVYNYSTVTGKNFRQGDFNSDGLPDLLIVGNNDQGIAVAYGGGIDDSGSCSISMTYYSDISSINDPDTDKDNDEDNVIVTDFNNDGFDDFILFNGIYRWEDDILSDPWKEFDHITVSWYQSTGAGFTKVKEAISTNHQHAQKENFVNGDFNGDGRLDLLNYGFDCFNQSSTVNEWHLYYSFNTNFEANKIKAIYNGLNQKIEFKYRPLSVHSDNPGFYIKGISSISNVINFQVPIYVVSSLIQPDGKGGNSITSYAYEGLRIHNKGKGLLGFEKITTSNNISAIKNITSNDLEPNYFSVKKQTTEVKTTSDQLISRTIADYNVKTYADNPKRIFTYPVKITSLDNLSGIESTKEFLIYDDDGNVLSLKEKMGPDATVEVQNTYIKVNAWCKSKLSSSTVKSIYGTETPDIKTSTFTYFSNGNLNTSLASGITNTYSYDGFGNVLSQTTTATGIISKTVRSTYDPTGRFTITTTNVLSQTSTFDYNDYGQLISETGIDGLSTQYAYDNWGKLKTVTFPNGKKSIYETKWLTNGNIGFYTKDITEGAPYIISKFDQFGRKVRTETEDFKGIKYADIVYDIKGQVERTISPYYVSEGFSAAHVTDYLYDQYGRATSVTSNGLTKTTAYSGKIITETFPSGETKVSTMDTAGKLRTVNNNGAIISYNYFSDGQIKNTIAPGSEISLTYDTNGFKDTLTDPDAGQYNFDYDVIGQLKSKLSPIGTYLATYDVAGRVSTENENTNNFTYTYVSSGNGLNQVKTISENQGVFRNYNYDSYGRVTDYTQKVGDRTMAASYQYDIYGRTTAINYPGGFGILYVYHTATGELIEIRTNTDQLVWKLLDVNSQGQLSKYQYGNNLETIITYDAKNFIRNITTGSVQNLTYTFDAAKGRFDDRTDSITGVTETFGYFTHNQLSSVASAQKPELNLTMTYDDATIGNIKSKSDVGSFEYNQVRNAGPHAITDITNFVSSSITDSLQSISYTSFNKVSQIIQGQYRVEFTYGADKQRSMMQVFQNEVLQRKVYYFGNYERHEEGSNVIELYYISSPSGLTAIYKKQNGADTMFYVHTDHLGSINVLTGQDQQVKARYYYNVWGERKNLDKTIGNTFQVNNDLPWFHRGFTGHEYITEIGLINMNGRVYDPKLAMFISPDPFVQALDNPINFNRYAYCYNNPLLYSDPSGNSFKLALIAMGTVSMTIGNLIDGTDNPISSAFNDASNMVNDFSNYLQWNVYQNDNTSISAGIDPTGPGISVNLSHKNGKTTNSLSAGIGFSGKSFVDMNTSYSSGGYDFNIGAGIGTNYKGWNASATKDGWGAGYGRTYYGEEIGPDKKSNKQTTGSLSIFFNHNSFRLENDFLAFNDEDRWRSNAFELTIGNFSIGSYLYNNDPASEDNLDKVDYSEEYLHCDNKNFAYGRWRNGQTYKSPFYIGYNFGNGTERIGFSNSIFQHLAQNRFAHERGFARSGLGGYQNYYMDYDHFNSGVYFGNSNPFTLFNGNVY